MPRRHIYDEIGSTPRILFALIVLIASTFAWYFYAFNIWTRIMRSAELSYVDALMLLIVHFGGVTISGLIGAILTNRIRRNLFLSLWISFGFFSSFMPLFMNTKNILHVSIISLFWAVSFGFGMPTCMGCFSDFTKTEIRGRMGGIIFFFIGVGMFLPGMLDTYGFTAGIFTLAICKVLGIAAIYLLKEDNKCTKVSKPPSYSSILHERPFFLYLITWSMFCLVNYLSLPTLTNFFGEEFVDLSSLIEGGISGIFALVGGVLSDRIGRKRIIIPGFVMLGIGYAGLGVFPQISITWYFYTLVDGIAWGMFGAVFIVTLWGDLSHQMQSEKYYAIGGLPFIFATFLQRAIESYLVELIPVSAVFSLASFFLFLAVILLMYAPETLPEKKIRERELRQYIEKAKKIKETHA